MARPPADTRLTLARQFQSLREVGRIGLLPFVPAGYPDLQTTVAILPELESAGATAIEIGIPFSDPVADGPVIQQAFTHALSQGVRVRDVLAAVASARADVGIPLLAMVSYSVVFRYGLDRFLDDAVQAGFDGLILPDLPPPEAEAVCARVLSAGLDTVLLVAPSTTVPRREQIVRLCSGFVYYLSVSGTTGERDRLPADLEENLRQLRAIAQVPLCVGFGISRAEHLAGLRGVADGAIVGSALVRQIQARLNEPPAAIAGAVGAFCRSLLAQA